MSSTIYLDHNASTPVRPEVAEAMQQALRVLGANPSSAHAEGQRVRAAVERAREQAAALVAASPQGLVFVSGGTEGDHLAIVGSAWAQRERGQHVAYAAIEHHAVHGAAEVLERLGWHHSVLPSDANGLTPPDSVNDIPAGTTVLALMLANNETGVVQPVAALTARAQARGIRVVCDAVQGAGKVPVDMGLLGVDYLVFSAHKFGGPKGAGALVLRERARLLELRKRFEAGLKQVAPDVVVHGATAPRLPNTVNASFPGARADHLLLALDSRGLAASAGAACASGAVEPSPVLRAMGVPRELAICAIRFSLGRTTTEDDVVRALAIVDESVKAARRV